MQINATNKKFREINLFRDSAHEKPSFLHRLSLSFGIFIAIIPANWKAQHRLRVLNHYKHRESPYA
ncbi:hypothetical protein A9237_12225 [Vibrio owensii]|nr:hypothetical protein A9237_12225 [Vibrio owensii]